MRIEIVAVGTELLLGQIADTNSAWLGDQLASAGVTSHFHQAVGDNHERITLAFRTALARSDGIIVCGGLGPTQDDITREAIADVMGVELVRDPEIVELITSFFGSRGRTMSANNLRQADVPVGASLIPQVMGTAPGLICPLGNKVIYAVPGVPYEMAEMFERGILPDLRARMAEAGEEAVIVSRVVRTWGASESGLAEALQGRIDVLDADDEDDEGVPAGSVTLAFLASGIEGIKVRITARAATLPEGTALLDREEKAVREAIEAELGDIVFGIDDESMEVAVAAQLRARGLTLGVAESLTGGLIASRLVNVPGASSWFRGGVVAYHEQVKFDLLARAGGPGGLGSGRCRHGRGCVPGHGLRRGAGHHWGRRSGRAGGNCPGFHVRRPGPARRSDRDPRGASPGGSRARAPVRGDLRPRPAAPAPDRTRTMSLAAAGFSQEDHSQGTL